MPLTVEQLAADLQSLAAQLTSGIANLRILWNHPDHGINSNVVGKLEEGAQVFDTVVQALNEKTQAVAPQPAPVESHPAH